MRLFYFIAIVILGITTSSCNSTPKHKPNTNIPPTFIKPQLPFKANANIVIGQNISDTIVAMHIFDNNHQTLDKLFRQLSNNQVIIIEYPTEERRSYTMANIGQSLDIIFLNANKMVIHTVQNLAPYSTNTFTSYEYAQYAIIAKSNFCQEKSIKECDIIKLLL